MAQQEGITGRIQNVQSRLLDDSKDAVELGAELAAGHAALAVARSFIVPANATLVDRLTGKGAAVKKMANSKYGSFVIAATMHTVATLFAPKNEKLHIICKLALNAATAELVARVPIQEWTDKAADKLLNLSEVQNVLGGGPKKDKPDYRED